MSVAEDAGHQEEESDEEDFGELDEEEIEEFVNRSCN